MSNSLQPHGLYSPRNCPGQNTGVGRDLPYPGIEPRSPALQTDSLPAKPQGKSDNINSVFHFVVVQLLSCVRLFAIPWTAACQAPLSSTLSQSLLRFMSVE